MATPNSDAVLWHDALALYRADRAASDTCPPDDVREDGLIDTYCESMDVLIIKARAPDHAALLLKLDLIDERRDGFVHDVEYMDAIRSDIRHLSMQGGH